MPFDDAVAAHERDTADDRDMPSLACDQCWRQYSVFAQARIRDEARTDTN